MTELNLKLISTVDNVNQDKFLAEIKIVAEKYGYAVEDEAKRQHDNFMKHWEHILESE